MKTKFFYGCMLMIFLSSLNGVSQTNTTYGNQANPSNNGSRNTAIGYYALNNTDTVDGSNVAVGAHSMQNNVGKRNVGIGGLSLQNNAGDYNIGLGYRSLNQNNNGSSNIAIGWYSLSGLNTDNTIPPGSLNRTIGSNIALGAFSLNYLNSGSHNIAHGTNSLLNLNNGSYNIAIGWESGENLVSGVNNVLIGRVLLPNNTENFNNNIIIATNGTGTGGAQQRIYVSGNGYTGIGLGNNIVPQNKLEIGGLKVSGTTGLRFNGLNGTTAQTVTPNGRVLTVNANGDVVLTTDQGSGGSTIIVDGTNTTVTGTGVTATPYQINAQNIYTDDGTLTANRTVSMNDNRLMFNTATNGAIYIGATTNVNDNTNFPTATGNYKLYVEGGILTEKVKVALRSTANWADYVLEHDYNLMPLNEVEAFIDENNHLPGIESANELLKNGLDLGDMQAKQMAKIEELTLYIIEQNKTLEKQSKEIEELKEQVKLLLEKR